MKLLIIAWFFPPTNTIAAVRLGGLAAHLHAAGHDVRVITGKDLPFKQTLGLGIPPDLVTYTRWWDVNAFPNHVARIAKRLLRRGRGARPSAPSGPPASPGSGSASGGGRLSRISDAINALYVHLFNFPDSQVGWLPFALGAGRRLLRDWQPDIVLASGPPFTTLLAGRLLSARAGAPWVAEFRDRWSDDPYYPPPPWRLRITRAVERRLIADASALVTVSEPWAESYRAKFRKRTLVVYNGYDELRSCARTRPGEPAAGPLRIVYTGGIYPGRRDPTPLFHALDRLAAGPETVRVEFYGTDPALVLPLAERAGAARYVTVHPEVTHAEAVTIQRDADVLLLMQWNDPREQGNVPGKFFEYLGARRPILVLGLRDGVPATIVRERRAGRYGESPEEILQHLREWIETKTAEGAIPSAPEQAREGFSRVSQYRKLEVFLQDLIAGKAS